MLTLLTMSCLTGLQDEDDLNDLNTPTGVWPQIVVDPPQVAFGMAGWELSRDITVLNAGDGDLVIGRTVSDGPFTLEAVDGTLTLASGELIVLSVDYAADDYGVFESTLQIHSDDPNTPITEVVATATNPWPELSSPAAVDLGELGVRCEEEVRFLISNTGLSDLTVSDIDFTSASTEIYVDSRNLPWVLAPGEEKTVKVFYEPHDEGQDEGTLIFLSNDVDNPAKEVQVVGHANWEDAC